MKFDDIIDYIGQFGRYQKRVYFLLCLPAAIIAMRSMILVFILSIPDHRCTLPDMPNDTYTAQRDLNSSTLNVTILLDDSDTLSKCTIRRMADSSGSNGTGSVNKSHAVTMETVPCRDWVYDTSVFTSTLISELDLVCERKMSKSHAQMLFMFGSLVGCLLLGPPADLFGRKTMFMVFLIINIIASIGQAFTFSFSFLCVFMFFNGFSTSSLYCVSFVLGMELVGCRKRSIAGLVIVSFFGIGVVLVVGLAYFLRDWQHLQLVTACMAIPFISYYWLIPESPRWLISRNRYAEAEVIIRRAARVNKREVPPEALKWDSLVMKEAQEPLWHIFTYPRLVIRTLIIYFNWTVCSIVYYGLSFNVEDLGGSIFLNGLLFGIVEIFSYMVCIFLLDRLGRKRIYIASLFIAGLSCAASPFPSTYGGTEYQWLTITFAILGKFGISGAFATLWLYSSELFPTVIRNSVMASSSLTARIGGAISPYIANMSIVIAGPAGQILPLEIFGCLSLIAGLIALFLPETGNAKLPETLTDADGFGKKFQPEKKNGTELMYLPVSTHQDLEQCSERTLT